MACVARIFKTHSSLSPDKKKIRSPTRWATDSISISGFCQSVLRRCRDMTKRIILFPVRNQNNVYNPQKADERQRRTHGTPPPPLAALTKSNREVFRRRKPFRHRKILLSVIIHSFVSRRNQNSCAAPVSGYFDEYVQNFCTIFMHSDTAEPLPSLPKNIPEQYRSGMLGKARFYLLKASTFSFPSLLATAMAATESPTQFREVTSISMGRLMARIRE